MKIPGLRGIGVDIVNIARVSAAMKRHGARFAERLCHIDELAMLAEIDPANERRRAEFLAGRF
jgi:holo-[acyl-carrier protein] synthase